MYHLSVGAMFDKEDKNRELCSCNCGIGIGRRNRVPLFEDQSSSPVKREKEKIDC